MPMLRVDSRSTAAGFFAPFRLRLVMTGVWIIGHGSDCYLRLVLAK